MFLAAAAVVGARARWSSGAASSSCSSQGNGQGHVQSVVLGSMLFVVAVQLAALGVIGDLLAANRVLIQRTLERTRRIELKLGVEPSHYEPGERRTGRAGEPPTPPSPRPTTVGEPAAGSAGGTEDTTVPLGGRLTARHVTAEPSRPATPTTSTARRTRSCAG